MSLRKCLINNDYSMLRAGLCFLMLSFSEDSLYYVYVLLKQCIKNKVIRALSVKKATFSILLVIMFIVLCSFVSIAIAHVSTTYWYDNFESPINKAVITTSPLSGFGGQFGSVYQENGVTYGFSGTNNADSMHMYTSTDGVNFTTDVRVLAPGGVNNWDHDIYLGPARVWKQDYTYNGHTYRYIMLYGAYNVATVYTVGTQLGLAYSDDINSGIWVKDAKNPIYTNTNAIMGLGAEPWGFEEVNNTGYLWINNYGSNLNRNLTLITSPITDLHNWMLVSSAPIFTNVSFCPYPFQYNGKFYILVTHQYEGNNFGEMDLWESNTPTFAQKNFIGTMYVTLRNNTTAAGDDFDTPYVVTNNVTNTVSSGNLSIYTASARQAVGKPWTETLLSLNIGDMISNTLLPEVGVYAPYVNSTSDIDFHNSTTAYSGLYSVNIPPSSLPEYIRFHIKQDSANISLEYNATGAGLMYVYAKDNRSNVIFRLTFINGQMKYQQPNGSNLYAPGTYTYNSWYNLRISFNDSVGTCSFKLINNTGYTKIGQDNIPLLMANTSVDMIELYAFTTPSRIGNFFIDDLNVSDTTIDYTHPTMSFNTSGISILGEENATINISLNTPWYNTISVNASTIDGTAAAGIDYISLNQTLLFQPGQTNVSFVVQLKNNSGASGNKQFTILLSNPINATFGTNATCTVTILENGLLSYGALQFENPTYYTMNTSSISLNIVRVNGSDGTATVHYSTSDGTATAGRDYSATSGILTFNPGITSQSITIPILYHYTTEVTTASTSPPPIPTVQPTSNLSFYVSLDTPSNNTTIGSPSRAEVLISPSDQLSSLTYNLVPGWDLVSVPLNISGTNITDFFPASARSGLMAIWGWNESTQDWMYYSPDPNDYFYQYYPPLNKLETGKAYWVKMNKSASFSITGRIPTNSPNSPVSPRSGWSLIGITGKTSYSPGTLYPNAVDVWAWNESTQNWMYYSNNPNDYFYQYYPQLTSIQPGDGHWVEMA